MFGLLVRGCRYAAPMAQGRDLDSDVPALIDLILLLMKRQRRGVPVSQVRTLSPRFLHLTAFAAADLRASDSDTAWRDHLQFLLGRWYASLDESSLHGLGLSVNEGDRGLVSRLLSGESIEGAPGFTPRSARAVAKREATAMAMALLEADGAPRSHHHRAVPADSSSLKSVRRLLVVDPAAAANLDALALRLGSWAFDGGLPPYVPRLRDRELNTALVDIQRRFTVVVGPPKAGKSRSVLSALQNSAPDAIVWWVNTARGVLDQVADALEKEVAAPTGVRTSGDGAPRFIVLDDLQRCGVNPVDGLSEDLLERLTRHAHVVATLHEDQLANWELGDHDRSAQDDQSVGASRGLLHELNEATIRLSPALELDELAGAFDMLKQSRKVPTGRGGSLPTNMHRLAEFLAAVDELWARSNLALQRGGCEGALVRAAIDASLIYPNGCPRENLLTLTAWNWQLHERTRDWEASEFRRAFDWGTEPIGGPGSPHAILQRETRDGVSLWSLMDALSAKLRDAVSWTPVDLVGVELPPEDLLRVASVLFSRGEVDLARRLRERLAAEGDSEAMVELSQQLLREGDDGWAEWHNRAFEAGNGFALNWAGLSRLAEGNLEMARTRLEDAVAAGYSLAAEHLPLLDDGPSWRLPRPDKVLSKFERGLVTEVEYLQEVLELCLFEADGRRRPANFVLEAQRRIAADPRAPLSLIAQILNVWRKPLDWADWPRDVAYDRLAAEPQPRVLPAQGQSGDSSGLDDLLVAFGVSWPLPDQWERIVTSPSTPLRWSGPATMVLEGRGRSSDALATALDALLDRGCSHAFHRLICDRDEEWWREVTRLERLFAAVDVARLVGDGHLAAAAHVAVLAASSNLDEVAGDLCALVPENLASAQDWQGPHCSGCDDPQDRAELSGTLAILDLLLRQEERARARVLALGGTEEDPDGLVQYVRSTLLRGEDRVAALKGVVEVGWSGMSRVAAHELTQLGVQTDLESTRWFSNWLVEQPWGRVLQRLMDMPTRRD